MQTVRAIYEDGKIELLTPIQGVRRSNLLVIVLDYESNDAVLELTEDERFMAASYSAVIEEDLNEDRIWESYLNVK